MYLSCYQLTIIWLSCQLQRLLADEVFPQDPGCQYPLGMENRRIKNGQLFSPYRTQKGFIAREARLNGRRAYCTPGRGFGGFDDEVYMTIDLQDEFSVTALALQGDILVPYSKKIKLSWSRMGEKDGYNSTVLNVKGRKGSQIEYVPLKPIIASKLKIQLENTFRHRCVRMEIYGCRERSNETYEDCELKQGILEQNYTEMQFTQTDSKVRKKMYSVDNLVFSRPGAWCLSPRLALPLTHWATIDMKNTYLIYGIQFKGLTQEHTDYKYMTQRIGFQYSLSGKVSSPLEGKMELLTENYKEMRTFKIPLAARYISLRMNATNKYMTCVKLELFGCQVTREIDVIQTSYSTGRETKQGISNVFLGLILLLGITAIAVVAMVIFYVKWKKKKSLSQRRGPLPDVPAYSSLKDIEAVETKEICEDDKVPIYEEMRYGENSMYEDASLHNKSNEKMNIYENMTHK